MRAAKDRKKELNSKGITSSDHGRHARVYAIACERLPMRSTCFAAWSPGSVYENALRIACAKQRLARRSTAPDRVFTMKTAHCSGSYVADLLRQSTASSCYESKPVSRCRRARVADPWLSEGSHGLSTAARSTLGPSIPDAQVMLGATQGTQSAIDFAATSTQIAYACQSERISQRSVRRCCSRPFLYHSFLRSFAATHSPILLAAPAPSAPSSARSSSARARRPAGA